MTATASRTETAVDTPAPRSAWHVFSPFAVMLVAVAGVYLCYRVFVETKLGQQVDTLAMHGADVSHPRIVEILNRTLNGTTAISLIAVCVVAAFFGLVRKRLDVAIGAALVVGGSNLTTELLKDHLTRANLDGYPAPNSFPSGHTTAATSVAFALIMTLPHAIRGMVTLIGSAYVTVIAVATVWAAWHRPS